MNTSLLDRILTLKPGKRIKGDRLTYTIADFAGREGSGVVYRASCIETAEDVAIKFFLPLYELNLTLFESSATQQAALEERLTRAP